MTADSIGVSELVAAPLAVRQMLTPGASLSRSLGIDEHLTLGVYNLTVCRIAARGTSKNLAVLEHSKALRVRIGLLRDLRELGAISVEYVNTNDNRADILTKGLDKVKFQTRMGWLGMVSQAA